MTTLRELLARIRAVADDIDSAAAREAAFQAHRIGYAYDELKKILALFDVTPECLDVCEVADFVSEEVTQLRAGIGEALGICDSCRAGARTDDDLTDVDRIRSALTQTSSSGVTETPATYEQVGALLDAYAARTVCVEDGSFNIDPVRLDQVAPAAFTALREVLKLHPRDSDDNCALCWDSESDMPRAYPCETVVAIREMVKWPTA